MMSDLLHFGLMSFSSIFVIVDPIGLAPVFIAMTPSDSPTARRRMARTAYVTAFVTLSCFAVAGGAIFRLFGITLPAFK